MKTITIPFDRIKLFVSCVLYLALFAMIPMICLYISLSPLMIFFLLTLCWFILKAALRSIKRLLRNKPICICEKKDIRINSLSDKTNCMNWKDIEKVTMKEKHHSVQFILFGEHIAHASGVYMIHIDYPFMNKKLSIVKEELLACFASHNISVETL